MAYDRPWKSYGDQLALLQSRGLGVSDETAALDYLERVGYYRLSAYWYPFRQFEEVGRSHSGQPLTRATDRFVDDTQFVDAVRLYLFDKQLRLLMMDALERIEVALRVDLAHRLGERDTFAHLNKSLYHPSFVRGGRFERWAKRCRDLQNRSKEDFIKHYRQRHGDDLPIWVVVETWDFGAVSMLFAMMKVADQQAIATKYGVRDWLAFQSWLRSLNYLRNLCAHHSRLWNRNVVDQPQLPDAGVLSWCDAFIGRPELIARPFLLFAIARHLVRIVCPETRWHERLAEHLDRFPGQHSVCKLSVDDTGAPEHWKSWWV
ncbi:abi family protein [Marinobacterium nitratireducens]|uniref:Abi family protein n=1 Tax=Marinobacterium nitratireducens TaxID=518897 RepID=A0A917Z9D2_9GAMM|nr:Abi family protein [Marinobacterium nitratireducens]GGO77587.1 abi family protein [Marinobacterium nitratireducens]